MLYLFLNEIHFNVSTADKLSYTIDHVVVGGGGSVIIVGVVVDKSLHLVSLWKEKKTFGRKAEQSVASMV